MHAYEVQILEETELGVRAVAYTLTRPDSALTFLVIPMVHVARPAFYKQVLDRFANADVIVAEGVPGRRAALLTASYRLAGRLRRDGLVLQSQALRLRELRASIICPDATSTEFASGLRRTSWTIQLLLLVGAPLLGVVMAILGPRRMVAGVMTVDDLPNEDVDDPSLDQMEELLGSSRDRKLVACLKSLDEERANDQSNPQLVGVCWGAEHVRAVIPALRHRGYRITSADWPSVL